MTNEGFQYQEKYIHGTITFCGVEWNKTSSGGELKSSISSFHSFDGTISNEKIGSIYISGNAFQYLNNNQDLHYKVLSLIYEQSTKIGFYAIVDNDQEPEKWLHNEDFIYCTVDTFLKHFPKNFMEIHTRVLLCLYRQFPNYGQWLKDFSYYKFFAKDEIEMGFILNSLISKNYISGKINENGDGTPRLQYPYKITTEGWNEIEKSLHNVYSRQVFIAMRFSPEMQPVREAIKRAIRDSGLEPTIIDEIEHINYIPLEILSTIKKSGFMIADLTEQNNGVYYEAGFAGGLNIPVIFTCKKDDVRHFDISQVNTILWKNEDELYTLLVKRLLAIQGK